MRLISLMFFLVITFIFSCTKTTNDSNEEIIAPIEKIHEDPIFKEIIGEIHRQFISIQSIDTLKEYLKDDKLSEIEEKHIPTLFGYVDRGHFLYDLSRQMNRIEILSKKYNLKNINYEIKKRTLEDALMELDGLQPKKTSDHSMNAFTDRCEDIRRKCIYSVAAESAIMHLGCAGLDLSVIGGIICHGAAFVYQYNAGEKCNLEAENCRR